MTSKKLLHLHYSSTWEVEVDLPATSKWSEGLVTQLLEVMHGQWLYWNVHMHDFICGERAIARKEELLRTIEDELDWGREGLAEEDQWLLEINLEDLDSTTGETQMYWLLPIQAAREYRRLTVLVHTARQRRH